MNKETNVTSASRYPCIRFMIFLVIISDRTVVGWNEQIYKEIQKYIANLARNF